ncbi:MAG: nickel insertion protein, partial [Candidatus Thorarchaeota archaeon]
MSKTVLIDAGTAGASGDMILSALINLIGDEEAIVPVAASLLIYDPAIRVRIIQETRESLSGIRLEVTLDKGTRFSPESLL